MCPSYNSRAAEFPELLSIQDKSALLQIARQSLTETIVHGRRWQPDIATGLLVERRGAFVTLELRGKLRGCVGQVETQKSLAWTVAHCAFAAAREDTRFNPVQPDEVVHLTIEISVLSQPKSITPNEVEIGRHGLVVERGPFRGLLLPQVAPDRNWTSEQFLSETCLKAGLPGDAWELSETRIFGFTAEVFSETEPAAQSSRSPSLRSSHQ
jgi:AmmeMemoRadiSam system protein A